MDFLFSIVVIVVGYLVGAFTLIPPLIVIFFGLPVTRKLNESGLLMQNNNIFKTYLTSMFLLPTVFVVIAVLIYFFFPYHISSFIIGGFVAVIMIIFSPSSLGANDNNISDYVNNNKQYFNVSIEEVIATIQKK